MIERFVTLALERRWLVVFVFLLLGVFGWLSWQELAVEAYPDIADVTERIVTQYPGRAAEEIEEQITIPIEREMNGTPGLQVMRSRSTFGLSLITMVFQDGVEEYGARQRMRERLSGAVLPPGAEPELDPVTSPVGEIYRYTIESPSHTQRELREYQQWIVVPTLRQVTGIADVASFGGETTQFQLVLDPQRLAQYSLSLRQVIEAIQNNNANAGGSIMVRGDQGFVVRGIGLVRNLEDLGNIVVTEDRGTPVFVRSLGTLQLGALARNGILGKNHDPDGVSGIVLLLVGSNPSVVLEGVHAKIELLNHGMLPPDVQVVPYLDRTRLVNTTLHTVSHTMGEGILLVCLVLMLFLGSPRSALIVATTIPLSILIAFILMRFTNIPANLLSLGAIDFGVIVDGAIVVMENILRERELRPDLPLSERRVREAATAVARPIFFATAIIITAYIPLFAFQRVEKKLFAPMAYTVGYALIGAVLCSLALIPGLSAMAFKKPGKVFHNRVLEWVTARYRGALVWVLDGPRRAILPGIVAAILAVGLGIAIGKEFLPELDEGSVWLQVTLPPGVSLQKASQMATELREATLQFPQVTYIVTQLGRNDDGTDSWTPSHIECSVGLRPYEEWPAGMRKHDLIDRMAARFARIPGMRVGFSQPIIDGVNEEMSGAHSDLVVKIFGEDLGEMRRIAQSTMDVLRQVRGSADVAIDQEPPLPQLRVNVDREVAARYGINVSDVAQLIEVAIGGRGVTTIFRGQRRYEVAVRLIESARSSTDEIGNLTLSTASGARVSLSQIARIELRTGESTITRETNRRHLTVKINLRGRDLSSFLAEAQQRMAQHVEYNHQLYQIEWGGQFENQQRAQKRLALIMPLVLTLIFLLLYAMFGTLRHAGIILVCVPLALLGGMVALMTRGMTLNVSSAVGFIALFGVAVQNGVIMVSNLNRVRDTGIPLLDAIKQGAEERLRPVLMTATVATLGMLPAALARGIGSDVQRPLATVVVGGLLSATLLTLFVLPALYYVSERWIRAREARRGLTSIPPPPPRDPGIEGEP